MNIYFYIKNHLCGMVLPAMRIVLKNDKFPFFWKYYILFIQN